MYKNRKKGATIKGGGESGQKKKDTRKNGCESTVVTK